MPRFELELDEPRRDRRDDALLQDALARLRRLEERVRRLELALELEAERAAVPVGILPGEDEAG